MAYIRCGGGGGLTETTLWTNSSPSSAFTGNVDYSLSSIANYSHIKVYYRYSTSNSTECSILVSKSDITNDHLSIGMANSDTTYTRWIQITSNTVWTLSRAIKYTTSSQTATNNYIIPTKITGVNI